MEDANVDPSRVLEEAAFAHIRQEAESIAELPFQIEGPLFLGEDAQDVSWSQTKCSMDEVSSRSEHRFTSQRACFEGLKIVAKNLHDVLDELLG